MTMVVDVARFILPLLILDSFVYGTNSTLKDLIYQNVPEDGRLNFTQMAIKYGQQCEEHTVTTEDGYLLKLFNIPGDKTKPVFLMHGVVDSSDNFIIAGNKSMAITLARQGYDVWVGNQRGNKYCRRHVTLDVEKDKKTFWNFTLQEIVVYDLTAMIDYVLNATGQTQLQAVGHSQGTTLFYILGSEKPEYNDKIKLFISLAPICYLHHAKSLAKVLINVWPLISPVFQLIGQYEIFPPAILDLKTFLCSQNVIGYEICAKGIFFPVAGADPDELDPELFKSVIGRYFDTSSIKNGNHLVQIALRKKFSQYDYGLIGNLVRYGSISPPDYSLKNVTMAIALIAGKNDNLSALEDVELLRSQLPNVVKYHVMEREQFNHIDYMWGTHMPEYLHPLVIDLLENYPQKS